MTRFSSGILVALLSGFGALACGGQASGGPDDDNGAGGTGSGGHPASGGQSAAGGHAASGGSAASGGNSAPGGGGAGGEPLVCCEAEALCDAGDETIASEADCPPGAECYSNHMCCSTVWCARQAAICDGIPVCQENETEVVSCAADAHCVERTVCGTSILCQSSGTCDPAEEYNRSYEEPAGECLASEQDCPSYTVPFMNACGCGCEQPADCPEWVDCMPGGDLDPLCSNDSCPFTQRAL